MGKVYIPGGGGGADTDVVTAGAGDVLLNKVIVGPDGEPLTGTMPNNGAVAPDALGAGGSYTIPAGYHNGSGKVTVQTLATLTSDATAIAAQMLSPATAYVKGNLITGTIPNLNGGTYTPTTAAQTIGCAGYYMNHNITIAAIPSTYVDVGGTWTVFNQGTFAANMGFVPTYYVMYGGWKTTNLGTAVSYSNKTYNGTTRHCVDMKGYHTTGSTPYIAVILNRVIDLSLFKTITIGAYAHANSSEGMHENINVFLMPTSDKNVDHTITTQSKFSAGWYTFTADVSSYTGYWYIGFGNYEKGSGIHSIQFTHV